MPSSEDLDKEIVPKPLQVFTRRSKNVVSTSLSVDLKSRVAGPDPHSAFFAYSTFYC